MADFTPGQKVHKFEIARLGQAPYRFDGCTEKVHVDPSGTRAGGSCDYCGTCIRFEFWLVSADGKRFKVGSDCILKTTSDRSLVVAVETEVQKRKREAREVKAAAGRVRDRARVDAAKALLPAVADQWKSEAHPRGFDGLTKLDWATWMLANAGLTGQVIVAKAIEEATGGR